MELPCRSGRMRQLINSAPLNSATMDDGSASIFCFTPLRVTISEWDRLRAAPPSPESSLGPVSSAPAIPQGPSPVCPSDSSSDLIALVQDVRREVGELRS